MSDAQAADPKGGGRNQCTCPAEPLRKHTGPYHNGQCSPGFAISLSAPDTTNADNVLAIAKRATSGDTVAPLSRSVHKWTAFQASAMQTDWMHKFSPVEGVFNER